MLGDGHFVLFRQIWPRFTYIKRTELGWTRATTLEW